ncbi:unnamed protein product [Echinostoma caproni]|uniref:Pecanex-like protein n=1 Tax=Echinostoma caproni TaxID=27848 RepID=A0A183ABS7_9TREM|nr:unnamed protein product [Echinostoma caproni]
MDSAHRTSVHKSSVDTSTCDVMLKQDRIARFAPEKQFSTTFRHRGPKLKRFDSAHLHQLFRHVIYVILTLSALASLILLLFGILWDRRSCLTAGCILGLACFGAMLHGCLRHRSLPSTPTPLVLSAAYLCPVGNLPIGSNPESTAAATAMATATLLPKSIHPNPSLMASSLEVAMLAQLRRDVSIAFPSGVPWASSHSVARQSLLASTQENEIILPPHSYKRQLSDSVAYTRSSGPSFGDSGSSVPEYHSHVSCPARTGESKTKSHVYENWCPDFCKPAGSSRSGERKVPVVGHTQTTTAKTERASLQPTSKVPLMRENSGTSGVSDPRTPQPGSSDFYKPPLLPTSNLTPCIADPNTGSITNGPISEESAGTTGSGSGTASNVSTSPGRPVTQGATQVRVISPEKTQSIRTPRSVLQGVRRESGLGSAVSTGLLRLLSDSTASNYDGARPNRRHNRDRDGVFGPRIWRAWRSWVD